jgi:hypothetical protein
MQCSIDGHPARNAIDADLALRRGGLRNIAQRYGVGAWSLHRHVHNCLKLTLEQSKELQMRLSAQHLQDELDSWHQALYEALTWARETKDARTCAVLVREARANIESLDRLAHPERAWTPTYRVELERHKRYEEKADALIDALHAQQEEWDWLTSRSPEGEEQEEVTAQANGHQPHTAAQQEERRLSK